MRWNPESGRPPARVLAIQLRRIGDAVLLTPALDAFRAAWPEARIHLLTSGPIPDLFAGDPRLDAVWLRPPRSALPGLAARLRAESYDAVFDFQSLPWTGLLARLTGGFTLGFAKRGRRRLYSRTAVLADHRGTDYAADHKLDLLRRAGLSPELRLPRLVPPREDPHPLWSELPPAPGWPWFR